MELWADLTILEINLELCPKGYKNMHTLWPSNIASETLSQRDHRNGKESHMYKNIYSSPLCGGQKLEIKGMPINWGMAEQVVVHVCKGILLCCKKWLMNRKTSERPGKTYMNWCWAKGAGPGELCTQQQPQRMRIFSGRLRTSLQCKDLKNSQWPFKAKCLPHPEKQLWDLITECSKFFSYVLCFGLFSDVYHSF